MPQKCSNCQPPFFEILVLLLWAGVNLSVADLEHRHDHPQTHSCIHDEILEQQRRSGVNQYKITPQVYSENEFHGRVLLESDTDTDKRQPIRIFLNYDAVGHSVDRDCRVPGEVVKLGEPAPSAVAGFPACNARVEPPVYGDCWYNCTADDITGEDKKKRLHDALGETAAWFRRALSVECVKGLGFKTYRWARTAGMMKISFCGSFARAWTSSWTRRWTRS